jgi:hypothetical protein
MVKRLSQVILILSTLALSWLLMQVVHEFGHVAGAWLTGGKVAKVVLHPLTISRTDVAVNPRPLIVVWAGPLVGILLPLAAWGVAVGVRCSWTYLLRFFAGFCLIANGAYIGVGAFDRIGDAGELLRHGARPWHLWLFGAAAVPAGLGLWHRLGLHFGLGKAKGRVSRAAAFGSLAVLVVVLGLMTWIGGE